MCWALAGCQRDFLSLEYQSENIKHIHTEKNF